jgi:hypothetical protein
MDPTKSQIHINGPLSNIAIAYKGGNYIADKIFPVVPVDKQSDKYFIWTKGFWMRNMVEKRTPGDTYPEGRLQLSSDEYYCDLFHLGYPIPDESIKNQDEAVQLEITGAEWLADQFLKNREIKIAATAFATASWDEYVTGGTDFVQWNDYDDSNPITDVDAGISVIEQSTGQVPNTLVMGKEVFNALKQHPILLELFKYTNPSILSEAQIKSALGIENLIIGRAVVESSKEGAATATRGYIWGKKALLMYVPPKAGLRVPSAGYTFAWKLDGSGLTTTISTVREDSRDRDLLKGKHAFDGKVTGMDLGYYFETAVS